MKYEEILLDKEKSKILAKIIGHLMGDGCVTKRYLRYNNKDKFLLNNFKNHFLSLYPKTHFIKGKVNSGTSFVQVQNKKLIEFLFGLCGDFRSELLRFPEFIKTKKMKKEFISAVYDDEGCVGLRIFKKTGEIKRNLDIGSKSKEFLGDIKIVLMEDFNVKSNKIYFCKRNLNGKEFITWRLSITGKENFVLFRENINFTCPNKIKKLDNMIDSYIR